MLSSVEDEAGIGEPSVSGAFSDGDLERTIERAVSLIGGFGRFVRPGDSVLLKPNFNSSDPPPASSDPEAVGALIRLLFKYGAGRVVVGESSMLLLSTKKVMRNAGVLRVIDREGAEAAFFGKRGWVDVPVGQGALGKAQIAREAVEAERLVYLCCLKTHNIANFSISLKHTMGMLRPISRIGWHIRGMEEKIAEANTAIHPDLILLDARKCFISGGPFKGTVGDPNIVLASANRVALDIEGIKTIQQFPWNSLRLDPWKYTQIRRAAELGLIQCDMKYRMVYEKAEQKVVTAYE